MNHNREILTVKTDTGWESVDGRVSAKRICTEPEGALVIGWLVELEDDDGNILDEARTSYRLDDAEEVADGFITFYEEGSYD